MWWVSVLLLLGGLGMVAGGLEAMAAGVVVVGSAATAIGVVFVVTAVYDLRRRFR